MLKFPSVIPKSLQTAIGLYLNDYYQIYDAAKEDHDVEILQVRKAIKEHNLETEDSRIMALKRLQQAIYSKFHFVSVKAEGTLSKPQLKSVKKCLQRIKLEITNYDEDTDDVLIFLDCLSITSVIVQLTNKFFIETCYRNKDERRAFLLKGKMADYTASVKKYQEKKLELQGLVTNAVLGSLEIAPELWNRSTTFYS